MPERKIVYESIKHKAEGGFLIRAPSLQRLFIDAALSLIDQQVSLDLVKDPNKQTVKVSAPKKELLMENWLTHILALFEAHGFLPKRIVFNHFDGSKIEATLFGDTYEPTRHGSIQKINTVHCEQLQLEENKNTSEIHFSARIQLL